MIEERRGWWLWPILAILGWSGIWLALNPDICFNPGGFRIKDGVLKKCMSGPPTYWNLDEDKK